MKKYSGILCNKGTMNKNFLFRFLCFSHLYEKFCKDQEDDASEIVSNDRTLNLFKTP